LRIRGENQEGFRATGHLPPFTSQRWETRGRRYNITYPLKLLGIYTILFCRIIQKERKIIYFLNISKTDVYIGVGVIAIHSPCRKVIITEGAC